MIKEGIRSKRAQVTILIIVAILIVSVVLVYVLYVQPNFVNQQTKKPRLDSCIENALEEQIKTLSAKSGVQNSRFTTQYLGENITLICYTGEYLKPCSVQEPFLKDTFEQSLSRNMEDRIQTCYDNSLNELRAQGYDVEETGNLKFNITIEPSYIKTEINAPTSVSRGEDFQSGFRKIEVQTRSDIYEIIMIANSILQSESSLGDAETTGYMFYYPDLIVDKIRRDDGIKIYIITDKNNEDAQFKFATRSYVFPPGYGVK